MSAAMEPRIQYAKTSDGVNIAYCTAGSGPALVWVQPPFPSHVQLEWAQPILRRVCETIITAGMTLVRFDARGAGLSDREVADISLAARLRDMEALVDRLGLDRFAAIAGGFGARTPVEEVVGHPARLA